MNENEDIYKRLKFLSDKIENLTRMVEGVAANQAKLIKAVDKLTVKENITEKPDAISTNNKYSNLNEIVDKVNYMKKLMKR